MARILAKTVHVIDPETRQRVVCNAGTTPPEWAVPLITNKRAWAEEPEPVAEVVDDEPTEPVVVADAEEPAVDARPEADIDVDTHEATAEQFGQSPLDTVPELTAWIGADPDRAAAVLAYETDADDPRPGSGRNRKGILSAVSAILGD